ncbi:unnamed protein product [Symbiodinium sp. CCMP2456]|nr:unnamed protein product [Symbiodinium sp. CCMP2456]
MLSPLQSLRGALDCLLRVRGEQKASQCRLDVTSFAAADFFYPYLDEEELESESSAGPNTALARKRAEKNLKDVLTPSGGMSFAEALDWFQKHSEVDVLQMQVHLEMVEAIFFDHALRLEDEWSADDLQGMEGLLDAYRRGCEKLRGAAAWKVESRSREVMVHWIAFCLIWRASEIAHPLVSEYGVGLDPQDVRWLLLRTGREIEALKAVDIFLRQRQQSDRSLFNLSSQIATIQFASSFSTADAEHQQTYRAEREAEAARIDMHWQQVQRQQEEAASLRREIAAVEPDLEHHEQELQAVQQATETLRQSQHNLQRAEQSLTDLEHNIVQFQDIPRLVRIYESEARTAAANVARYREEIHTWEQVLQNHLPLAELQSIVQRLQSKLKQLRQFLKEAETPPAAVFQPLPEREDMAFAILFFLYMPELLRSLSRATILARQLLLPWPWCCQNRWDVSEHIQVKDFKTCWAKYYNEKQSCVYHTPPVLQHGEHGPVKLLSSFHVPDDRQISGTHIDNMTSARHGALNSASSSEMLCQ